MQIIYIFMNDFLWLFCIFMNDFGANRHTFMNDFGVLFHQNARIFLVIPLCQRSLVMSLCDVLCAIGTLLMLSMLYVAGRRWCCCYVGWLYSANHRRELNQWGVAYLFYCIPSFAEGIPNPCRRSRLVCPVYL